MRASGGRMLMSLVLMMVLPASPQSTGIALLTDVTVKADLVRVSDLLPSSADAELRSLAESVVLGRAPEPGSLRVYTGEELERVLSGWMQVRIPAAVVVRSQGWPLRGESIIAALQAFPGSPSWNWGQSHLVLPPGLITHSPGAETQVLDLLATPGGRSLRARLRCRARRDCGTFWAEVVFAPPAPMAPERLADLALRSGKHALVEPGKPASLLFEHAGLRIRLRVLPMRRAFLGDSVRVLDPATRRTFLATVEGENLVRSELREGQ